MPDSNPTTLLLAVPGPEQYAAVPKAVVRNAIKQGQIRQSQLIWSPPHNDWMQVRDLPHLAQDTQLLEPAPVQPESEEIEVPLPAAPEPPALVTPKERPAQPPKTQTLSAPNPVTPQITTTLKAPSGPIPKAKASPVPVAAGQPKAAATPSAKHVVHEDHDDGGGVNVLKLFTIILFFSILGLIGSNYLLVDQPLSTNLARTKYANVPVHAHLFGFYQPGALAIHLFSSPQVTESNLLDFLTALAQSTPRMALKGDLFDVVSLAPGLSMKYAIQGQDWNQFSQMTQASETERKSFLLQHLTDNAGTPLLSLSSKAKDNEEALEPTINTAWQSLAAGLLSAK